MDNIRYDYLHYHPDYKVAQHKDMYHFNTDTCLLGEFIKINPNETVLDVGTNNGALLVYICKKGGIATGIEINADALKVCELTLKANDINATLINKDGSTSLSVRSAGSATLIVSNLLKKKGVETKYKSYSQKSKKR